MHMIPHRLFTGLDVQIMGLPGIMLGLDMPLVLVPPVCQVFVEVLVSLVLVHSVYRSFS